MPARKAMVRTERIVSWFLLTPTMTSTVWAKMARADHPSRPRSARMILFALAMDRTLAWRRSFEDRDQHATPPHIPLQPIGPSNLLALRSVCTYSDCHSVGCFGFKRHDTVE